MIVRINAFWALARKTRHSLITHPYTVLSFLADIDELTTKSLIESFGVQAGGGDKGNPETRGLSVFDKIKFLNFGIKDLTIEANFGGQMKIQ